ncbi:MAG: ATP-binding protein [Armatimonadetes bacterium]|nr:ATP-binding protein [Armatimonadota bacterium]
MNRLLRILRHHDGGDFYRIEQQNWYRVQWEEYTFEVVLVNYTKSNCSCKIHFIITPDVGLANAFFLAVTRWSAELREEVWVFNGGYWGKSEELYRSIQSSSLDNLVLPADLKAEIHRDLKQFLASRELYNRYRIPWKRGILLLGPPGNGKTHAIKALVNDLKIAPLYVKSFTSQYGTDQGGITSVFQRARETTPCLLILEDLDSLITDKNRSFFLNELDGFAGNTGIIVLATTNHPEKLDPAIVNRPSRFDRKYHFELPAVAERVTYLNMWISNWESEMRPTAEGLDATALATDGFSFAYLKELLVSALMRWINLPQGSEMDAVLLEQCHLLRSQMSSMVEHYDRAPATDDDGEEE